MEPVAGRSCRLRSPKSLFGADEARLSEVAAEAGQPRYRGRQLFEAMYGSRITSFEEISNLPKDFRLRLKEQGYSILRPSISRQFQSTDGTIRYLVEMNDGESVETVWMPEGDAGESGDGSEAGEEEERSACRMGSGDDLRFEPGGMCRELPVLPDGSARRAA